MGVDQRLDKQVEGSTPVTVCTTTHSDNNKLHRFAEIYSV